VRTQPSSPAQTCTVSNGSGSIAGANVANVSVKCAYTVGGTVSIPSGTLVLQNNSGDDLAIATSGSFVFATALNTGATFNVTILSAPAGQECTVTDNSGTVGVADVASVNVLCTEPISLQATALSKAVRVAWSETNGASYNLYRSTDADCDYENYGACTGGTLVTSATSPHDATELVNGTPYYFHVEASYAGGHTRTSRVAAARPGALIADKPVRAMATGADGTIYLGGEFTELGVAAGGGVPFSLTNPWPSNWDYAQVVGWVYAAVSDGAGGFYIGGKFSRVGGAPRTNLAHILADGSVDSGWAPGTNGAVYALAVDGGKVYLGGAFSTVNGEARKNIAAVDATNGAAMTWAPNADFVSSSFAEVYALTVVGSTVLVGGRFETIGGQPRNNIAAVDVVSGTATTWNPDANGRVNALAVNGSLVYIGGAFTTIGGQARKYTAALDLASDVAAAWNPNAGSTVESLAVQGTTVYAGGGFTTIGGQQRNHIAALDASSGAATAWNPDGGMLGRVRKVVVDGDVVYVGGDIDTIGGQSRRNIAAIDAATGLVKAWSPDVNDEVYALAVSGGTAYVGGTFTMIGGTVERSGVAALSAGGSLNAWNPNADHSRLFINATVRALTVSGGTVYAGGEFTRIGGQNRNNIAALDAVTGAATTWDPNASNTVSALLVENGKVYAGGIFSTIGGQSRRAIAAIDPASGTATAWNPSVDTYGYVSSLAVAGGNILAAGSFQTIGGASRSSLAAIDATTGAATSWNPGASSSSASSINIDALAVGNGVVYVSGNFDAIGGQARSRAGAVDSTTGVATSWNPNPAVSSTIAPSVKAIAPAGSTVYVAGFFDTIGGQTRNNLAALDAAGAATSWDPGGLSSIFSFATIYALAVTNDAVYVGGEFFGASDMPANNLAVFPR
jgi:hypothetical protein